jgi:hypothetical protein
MSVFGSGRFDREAATRAGFARLNLKGVKQFDAIGGGSGSSSSGVARNTGTTATDNAQVGIYIYRRANNVYLIN